MTRRILHVILRGALFTKGFIMKQFYSDMIQYRGSHYEFGFWQGKQLRKSFTVMNRHRQWRLRRPKFHIDLKEAKVAYEMYAPGLWAELVGLSDGLQLPLKDVLRDFGGYRVPIERSGCTTVVTDTYLVRNYDYHPKTYEGRYVLFAPTDNGYATIGPSQRIVGRMDGMNEHGLSIAYNFMHRKHPGKGFICHAIGRIILEQAKDVQEAVALLKALPHRHSFSYMLVDKSGQKMTVEATPRTVTTHTSPFCTNHFHKLKAENRRVLDESIERLQTIKNYWRRDHTVKDVFSFMNDPQKGVFVEDYKSWAGTIHTTAYIPEQLEAWVALGGKKEPEIFSFQTWLNGQNIPIKKIAGTIRSDVGFMHMGKV